MPDDPIVQYIVQLGGFGIAAYLVIWLTKGLNGKLDRLAESMLKLSQTIEDYLDRHESKR